ncbi:MAG: cell division FtsA domain-containing protein [Candidatus Dojkabacteria bacterium]
MFERFKKVKTQNSSKKPSYLSVDIGTEYIKCAVFIVEEKEVNIIGYTRVKQKSSAMYAAFVLDITEVVDALDKSIGEAIGMAKEYFEGDYALPKDMIIGIAGESVQGVNILVNVERESPDTEITEKEIEQIIQKVKKHTFESTKEDLSEELGIPSKQLVEIDSYINSVYIDGVRVLNALGYKGSELVYRVFSTFAPRVHIDTINQIARLLKVNILKIVVEPYAVSMGMNDMRRNDANGIIIDIGGGTTDVAIVKNGDIVGTKMFAIGGRVFSRRIEKEKGLSYEDAEDKKLKFIDGKLTNTESTEIRRAFENDIKIWASGVEVALEEFEDVNEYPPNIYLCGGGALLPQIQEELISYPWMQSLNFKKYPKVNFIFPNAIRNVTDKTKTATMPIDVAPLALARMILDN